MCTAWLSFYAQVPHEPELARLHRVYMRRLQSNLRHAFEALLAADAAARAAEGMAALIDGLWVQAALSREAPRERARALANDYLRMVLQEHGAAHANADDQDRAAVS